MKLMERLATLLDYPDEQTAAHLEAALAGLRESFPEVAEALADWGGYLSETPVGSIQEHYTQTFDLNPACSLDVGYYLFGEDYQRGMFLANLRESQEAVGLEGETELPDHLPVLLRWLARVWGTELHTDLVSECVLPAMRKMDECLANGTNPYRGVLQAIARVLERDLSERGISISDSGLRLADRAAAFRNPAPELGGIPIFSGSSPSDQLSGGMP
jgi:nitrate reductase molybdenum cofactor assembly chaperone